VRAGVDAGDDRVHDARRAIREVRICDLEWLSELRYSLGMTLKAIIHPAAEGGFWAEVPALPGCLTQAETLDELKANLREAIELWLSVDDEVTESNVNDRVMELTV
jgi:predicted RNase H-like HicB family nuclease